MRKKKNFLINLFCVMGIGIVLAFPLAAFADCPDGIVAYYKLDEANGDSGYADYIAGNDGDGATADPVYTASGQVDGGQTFNGSAGIDVAGFTDINWSAEDSFSVEAWMKADSPGGANTVIVGRGDATGTGVFWWLGIDNAGAPVFYLRDGDAQVKKRTATSADVADGNFYHLAATVNLATGEIAIYVDGVLQSLTNGSTENDLTSGVATSYPLNIGYVDGNFYFTGVIDEVALYDGVLSVDTISSHASSGTDYCDGSAAPEDDTTFAPYPDDTVAFYALDEANGDSGYADSFGGNDGDGATADPVYTASGQVDGGQTFNGNNTGIDVAGFTDINWAGSNPSFTVELWANITALPSGTNAVLVGRGNSTVADNDVFWWLGVDQNGDLILFLQDGAGQRRKMTAADADLTIDTFYHIVATVNPVAGEYAIYVNGASKALTLAADPADKVLSTTAGFPTNKALNIGYVDADFYFEGVIDEVALYNKAMTQADVTEHYNTGDGNERITALRPAPTANAGTDIQAVGNGSATVTLDASGSSTYTGATITGWAWTQVGTPAVTLSDATAESPTFTAPLVTTATTLTFSLMVTSDDGQTSTAADTVDVALTVPSGPTADAGDAQSVTEGDTVTLNASGSSAAYSGALTYAWTAPTGVTLSSASAEKPTFTAPDVEAATEYEFEVTVTEAVTNLTDTDTVTITVTPEGAAAGPDADAGADQSVKRGATVTLDGSASTPSVEGATLTYAWTQTDDSGYEVELSDATAVQPTFTAPSANTTLTFQLEITEADVGTDTDTVTITVTSGGGGGGSCFIDSMF